VFGGRIAAAEWWCRLDGKCVLAVKSEDRRLVTVTPEIRVNGPHLVRFTGSTSNKYNKLIKKSSKRRMHNHIHVGGGARARSLPVVAPTEMNRAQAGPTNQPAFPPPPRQFHAKVAPVVVPRSPCQSLSFRR
jgi:hypothetical protein